jgi:hypothetical protein
MEKNKTGKYLKYAIGEIVLVVLGILIALQVNNLNEDRKLRKIEIGLLQELNDDLSATMEDLVTDIDKAQLNFIYIDSLYQSMTLHKIEKTSKPFLITGTSPNIPLLYPKLGAYEALQNFGINNISNDSLRRDITDFYQLHLTRLNRVELEVWNLANEELPAYLREISEPTSTCLDCFSISDVRAKKAKFQMSIQQPTDKLFHLYRKLYFQYKGLHVGYRYMALTIENLQRKIDTELEKK